MTDHTSLSTTLPRSMTDNPRIAFIGVMLLATLTRLLGIFSRPIWYDEAFAILFSEKGPAAMLRGTLTATGAAAADVHPIAYYTTLWLWMRAFGESIVAVRLFSIFAGLAVVAVVILLTRELFDAPTALAAGLLTAVAPFQVHFSQEIRMYVFLALWLLLATYCYWRASLTMRRTWWLGFALFAALAQYTHNLAAFYLVSLALWPVLARNWRVVRAVVISGVVALLLYMPWFIHLPAQLAKIDQAYWIGRPGLDRVLALFLEFVVSLPQPTSRLGLALFITLFVLVLGLWQTFRAVRAKSAALKSGLWMMYLAFFPPLLLFLFSQWRPVYLERALLPSGAIFCIWVAWALTGTRLVRPIQAIALALLLVGVVMGLYQHVTDRTGLYGPYKELMQSLETRLQAGDIVVHSNKLSMLPSVYFDRVLPQTYVADPPGSGTDTLAPATQQVLGLEAQPDIAAAVGGARRVWFILYDVSNQEYVQAGYAEHPHLTWLKQHYSQISVEHWESLQLYLFSKTP